ncbi:MAG TPA: histidine phosphatase family protein, partial [Symbiobacteriaceae bacterium]|nr:histidine phosphatase family protein [Symbiobacteriaceae bacterium]
MTTFYIVRHGETDYNRDGRYQGQTDIPLNDHGRAQGRYAARRLAGIALDTIYSSDLSRAAETARLVAGDRPVVLEPRLREIHVGRVAGMGWAEIAEAEPAFWVAFQVDSATARFPDGESAADLQRRAVEALEAIHRQYPEGHVGIITHGGVIKTIVAAVLEMPLVKRSLIV